MASCLKRRCAVVYVGLVATGLGAWAAIWARPLQGQEPPPAAQQPAQDAGAGRVHVGTLKCAACHFQQYRVWRDSRHARAFDILPAKYKQDASCLKCHTTGYGQATGYKGEATANLAQVSCEACHGPGSEHAQTAIGFLEKEITPAGEQQIRNSIEMLLSNVCLDCHVTAAHKPHPPYDKE